MLDSFYNYSLKYSKATLCALVDLLASIIWEKEEKKMEGFRSNNSLAWDRLSLRECKSKDNKVQGTVETSNNTNTNIFLFLSPLREWELY